jgi:hypothetical protein
MDSNLIHGRTAETPIRGVTAAEVERSRPLNARALRDVHLLLRGGAA